MQPDNIIPLNQSKSLRADAARNRRLLLDTAETLFANEGVASVTMSAIAQEAGVGKGTLYRHFSDKAELCHALLDEDMREFQTETLQRMSVVENAQETLEWFLGQAARYTIDHSDLLREVANQGGIETIVHPAHLWWQQTIRGLLARLQPAGDNSYIADVLYIMLDVQTIRYQRRTQGYDYQRIVDGLHMTMRRLLQLSTD